MLSRKHYEAIAAILAQNLRLSRSPSRAQGAWRVTSIALDLADVLAKDNPRFDRERFLQAAGVRATHDESLGDNPPFEVIGRYNYEADPHDRGDHSSCNRNCLHTL